MIDLSITGDSSEINGSGKYRNVLIYRFVGAVAAGSYQTE